VKFVAVVSGNEHFRAVAANHGVALTVYRDEILLTCTGPPSRPCLILAEVKAVGSRCHPAIATISTSLTLASSTERVLVLLAACVFLCPSSQYGTRFFRPHGVDRVPLAAFARARIHRVCTRDSVPLLACFSVNTLCRPGPRSSAASATAVVGIETPPHSRSLTGRRKPCWDLSGLPRSPSRSGGVYPCWMPTSYWHRPSKPARRCDRSPAARAENSVDRQNVVNHHFRIADALPGLAQVHRLPEPLGRSGIDNVRIGRILVQHARTPRREWNAWNLWN